MFLKKIFQDSKKVKKIETMYKIKSLSLFLDIAKFADFRQKNADVSRTQGVCHVIYILFGSSLGKV